MIDARDLDCVRLDLIDSDIERIDQLAPSVHASWATTMRKVLQRLADLIDTAHRRAGCSRIVFRDALKYTFQVVRGKCRPSNFRQQLPSGIE